MLMNFLWVIIYFLLAVAVILIGLGIVKIGLLRAFAYFMGITGIVLIGLGSSLMPGSMWRDFAIALFVIGLCMELGFIAIICLTRKK